MVRVPWCISACFEPALPRQRVLSLAGPGVISCPSQVADLVGFISGYLTLGILVQLRRNSLTLTIHRISVKHIQLVASLLVLAQELCP